MSKRHPNRLYSGDAGCACFLVLLMIMGLMSIYEHGHVLFNMPTYEDYTGDVYREKAEEEAKDYLLDWRKQQWKAAGFSESSDSAKEFDTSDEYQSNDVADRTRYQGDGVYDVRIVLRTRFDAHSPDHRTSQFVTEIHETFLVTVKVVPEKMWYGTVRQHWTVIGQKFVKVDPDYNTVVQTLQNWPQLPSKNGDW